MTNEAEPTRKINDWMSRWRLQVEWTRILNSIRYLEGKKSGTWITEWGAQCPEQKEARDEKAEQME